MSYSTRKKSTFFPWNQFHENNFFVKLISPLCNDYYLDIVSKKYLFFPFPEIKQKESHRQKSGSTKFCNFFYKRRDTKIDKMRLCAVRPKSCQELFSQAFLWRRPCLYSDPKSLGRISSVRISTLILLRHAENHVYVCMDI